MPLLSSRSKQPSQMLREKPGRPSSLREARCRWAPAQHPPVAMHQGDGVQVKPRNSSTPRTVVHKDSRLRKASDHTGFDIHTFAASVQCHSAKLGTGSGNAAFDCALIRARLHGDLRRKDARPDDGLRKGS